MIESTTDVTNLISRKRILYCRVIGEMIRSKNSFNAYFAIVASGLLAARGILCTE